MTGESEVSTLRGDQLVDGPGASGGSAEGSERLDSLRGLEKEDRERRVVDFFADLEAPHRPRADPEQMSAGDFLRAFTEGK